ncbi:MAG: site-specific tyrosine recombinase XerD [Bacteroidales bacterium]|nr:site-specific tyrosine recombinase XerD [Bacteroidales bacterium]
MSWDKHFKDFEYFLRLEKSLSENSIEAYIHDIRKLHEYLLMNNLSLEVGQVEYAHITEFIYWLNIMGIAASSQARILSGIKAFFKFLELDEHIAQDPSLLVESPRLGRKLPDVLSIKEIDEIINALDLSKNEGQRNRAMLETLYSCGLRVSELVSLKVTNLYFNEGYIRVIGKGDKERLVPISNKAVKEIGIYIQTYRNHIEIKKDSTDILFLNRRGGKLTRVMIFTIIKNTVEACGIKKTVSPHTFRHSFATHLVDGGADLRAVQEMLGHESITTTEIYTHLDKRHLVEAINKYHPRSNRNRSN